MNIQKKYDSWNRYGLSWNNWTRLHKWTIQKIFGFWLFYLSFTRYSPLETWVRLKSIFWQYYKLQQNTWRPINGIIEQTTRRRSCSSEMHIISVKGRKRKGYCALSKRNILQVQVVLSALIFRPLFLDLSLFPCRWTILQ